MKKNFAITILALALSLSVCACGNSRIRKTPDTNDINSSADAERTDDNNSSTSTDKKSTDTKDNDSSSQENNTASENDKPSDEEIDQQIQLIADTAAEWVQDNESEPYFYTVTDLDHNGRLEVLAASLQGTGLYTYVNIYEVNESKDSIGKHYESNLEDGDAFPDVIIDGDLLTFTDGTDYIYIASDNMRINAGESLETITAFSYKDSQVTITPLATKNNTENGSSYQRSSDDSEMTEEEFQNITLTTYTNPPYTKTDTSFHWDELKGDGLTEKLRQCYDIFSNGSAS